MLGKRKSRSEGNLGSWRLLSGSAGAGVPSDIASFWSEQARQISGTPGKGFARPEWWRVCGTQGCSSPARAQPAPRVPGIGARSLAGAAKPPGCRSQAPARREPTTPTRSQVSPRPARHACHEPDGVCAPDRGGRSAIESPPTECLSLPELLSGN